MQFTTAKLAKIDFGKNEKASPATTTFNVGDKVFIVSEVTGAIGKHKMKFDIAYEAPAGSKVTSPPFSKETDFDGSTSPYFMLPVSIPAENWTNWGFRKCCVSDLSTEQDSSMTSNNVESFK